MNKIYCNLFLRNSLSDIGGIETYVYKSIKEIIKKGDKAGWISNDFSKINPAFSALIGEKKVYLIDRGKARQKIAQVCAEGEFVRINIITFCPRDFACAEILKKELKRLPINTFLFVPHFQGDFLYLEEGFQGNARNIVEKKLSTIYQKMEQNGNLLYFSRKHLAEYRKRYGCKESDFSHVSIPEISAKIEFNEDRVKAVFNQAEFTILSVSRLEFPHKGYVLGLVDAFESLCQEYESIRLIIVGDGDGMPILREKIDGLRKGVAQRIEIVGAVSPNELSAYYDRANVLISLAGCFTLGARRGVLSLPARHYTEKCEVYGYLPGSKDFSLADSNGYDVVPFLKEIINMSFNEYMKHCRDCYESFPIQNQKYFDRIENKSKNVLEKADIFYIKGLSLYNKVKYLLKRVKREAHGV